MKPLLTDNETFDDYIRHELGQVEVDASLAEKYWSGVKLSPTVASRPRWRMGLWISGAIVIFLMLFVLQKGKEPQHAKPIVTPTDVSMSLKTVAGGPHQPDSNVNTNSNIPAVNVISCPQTLPGKNTIPDRSQSNQEQTNLPSDKTETPSFASDSLKKTVATRLQDTLQTTDPVKPSLPEKAKKKSTYIIW